MCTLVLLRRPDADWPLLAAANRDEAIERPWRPPGPHWPGRPVTGGLDTMAGGTWMALNRHGVLAAVLNRAGTLGPLSGKRSRGELPLLALEHASAAGAADALARLDTAEWRGFNLVIADRRDAFCLRGLSGGAPEVLPLPEGVSMITARDPNTQDSPRTARFLPRFRQTAPPAPPDWGEWPALMADQSGPEDSRMCLPPLAGYGTVCGSLLGIPRDGQPLWLFAADNPRAAPYQPVIIPPEIKAA